LVFLRSLDQRPRRYSLCCCEVVSRILTLTSPLASQVYSSRQTEEFGMERLSATVRSGSSLSAEDLMSSIYNAAADFCGDNFNDDVTILVVKCDFDSSSSANS
jgi:Stage II sporulation protein E (SpoIIE)